MQNYFHLETDAAHRQREWARALTAMTQAEQARPGNGRKHWSELPDLALAYLRSLFTPRVCQSRQRGAPLRRAVPTPWQEVVPLVPDRAAVR